MIGRLSFSVLLCALALAALSCFRNPSGDAESEFRESVKYPGTASGSTLTYMTCGWPVTGLMKLNKLKVDMFPDSTMKEGRGYALIQTEGENFKCEGKLFFVYGYTYTGGHGYSGGTGINISIIDRESEVDERVSTPSSAVEIMAGETISGELIETDSKLPDGSYADFYFLELAAENPAIKFTRAKGEGLHIKGAVYQQKKLASSLSEFGFKLKPGRAVILVTAGKSTGRYTLRVDNLSDEEKSKLK